MNLFTLMVALLLLFSFVLAVPANIKALADKQEVNIIYHKADSNVTIQVLSGGSLVGQSCSSSLSSDAFEKLPIVFDVDERGRGNLTVGGSTYRIHENATYSGGIVCGRMFNRAEAAVSCTVAVPADLTLQPLSNLDIAECIPKGPNSLAKTIQLATSPPSDPMDAGHSRRSIGPPGWHDPDTTPRPFKDPPCSDPSPPGTTQRDGDGDPHQNYYHLQLSVSDNFLFCPPASSQRSTPRTPNTGACSESWLTYGATQEVMSCGAAPSCTVGYSESEGITIGFTASTDFGMEHFITAGFMVQMTWNTGTDYHCGGEAGDTVCIWYKTAHTAYTVNQFFKSRCDGTSWLGDPWVLISPNQDNDGGGQYCVVGTCRHMGSAYWDYDGPAGAPGA